MLNRNKPKRILHIFGQMYKAGAESRTMDLYRACDRQLVQFDFIVMKPGEHYFFEEIRELGGRIFHIEPPLESGYAHFTMGIVRIIREYGPFHAMHAHTAFNEGLALLAGRIGGVEKRIAHSRSASELHNDSLRRRVYSLLMRQMIILNATDLVTCGREAGRFLFGETAMKSGRVKTIRNAIDLAKYREIEGDKEDLRRALKLPLHKKIIGHVGNFRPVKNHKFLLRLFEYIRARQDAILVLVGTGPLQNEVRDQALQLGLLEDVLILGQRDDIAMLMNSFDALVLPSLYEGVPGVIVEAQAAGLPCLISDTVTREVDVGTGLLRYISLDAPIEDWAEALESLTTLKSDKRKCWALLSDNGYDVSYAKGQLMEIYGIGTAPV